MRLGILAFARHSFWEPRGAAGYQDEYEQGTAVENSTKARIVFGRGSFMVRVPFASCGKGHKKDRSYLRTPLKMGFRRLFASGQSPTGYFFGGYLPAATLESSCFGPFGPCAENPSDRIIRDTPQTRTNSPVMLPGRLKNHIKKADYGEKKRGKSSKEACLFRFGMYIEIIKIN